LNKIAYISKIRLIRTSLHFIKKFPEGSLNYCFKTTAYIQMPIERLNQRLWMYYLPLNVTMCLWLLYWQQGTESPAEHSAEGDVLREYSCFQEEGKKPTD
jgi:hypothetical protein